MKALLMDNPKIFNFFFIYQCFNGDALLPRSAIPLQIPITNPNILFIIGGQYGYAQFQST